MEKIYIAKGQYAKFETFMEQICEKNRLYNYIGAMNMALENVIKFANQDLILSVSHYKDGIHFSVQVDNDLFSSISFSDTTNADFETLFLIKSLPDDINISADGKSIDLFFAIDGIEEELAMSRREKIKAYSFRKVTVTR